MCLMPVLKNHQRYSFGNFESMLKVYLGLRGGALELELDVYEYCHKVTVVNGQFRETVRASLALQVGIDLCHHHFEHRYVGVLRLWNLFWL